MQHFLSNSACALLSHVTRAAESPESRVHLKAVCAHKVKVRDSGNWWDFFARASEIRNPEW